MIAESILVFSLLAAAAPGACPEAAPPPRELVELGRRAVEHAEAEGRLRDASRLTLIDYRLPSTEPRLWVLDLESGRVLFHELVAHGRGTGENRALHFSNRPGSKQTSLGVFVTAETYEGSNGYSLRLDGLEAGVNDRARDRAIVMHGAWYVDQSLARKQGRIGRSWGCPAVREDVAQELIDEIAGGSLLLAFGDDEAWLASSPYLAPAEGDTRS